VEDKNFSNKSHSAISYFDGSGKQIRPFLILALGKFLTGESVSEQKIQKIAMTAEMIHTASLMHDDVLDESLTRRNKETLNEIYDDRNAVLIGNYVVGEAMRILASIGSPEVIESVTKSMTDLIEGELLQLSGKDKPLDFELYTKKSFLKTGSLMANSLKAASQISHPDDQKLHDHIYEFGKSLGIAFQIIDDCLDFTSDPDMTGKPGQGADIKLGLVTAPVIFAAKESKKIEKYVLDGFVDKNEKNPADKDKSQKSQKLVDETVRYVKRSKAIPQSLRLAEIYAANAVFELKQCCAIVGNDKIDEICDEIEFILSRNK